MDLKPALETNRQRPTASPVASHGKPESDGFSWLQPLALAFLTFNSGAALYRSRSDPWGVAFVVTSYVDLLSLFWCLRRFESTHEGSPGRGILKMAVWSLSTLLTAMFSYRVAAMMPLPVAVVVWAMAGLTIAAGFYAFFIYKEKTNPIDVPNPSKV
ncbi:uncharacterized protein LOC120108917 [Phoenix dactylifera]|uniref:Uncharacterized protein LOC120108917 n=1 Tax=Phoenix dactylifera TaxID=42345 RepID=A0A8B8ZYW1_PHODC|nr:uncharacterized protein LOC120108917 [Phoenix dactylifera]